MVPKFCFRRGALQTGRQGEGRGRLRRDQTEGATSAANAHRS
jgi:hypothetical protein